MSSLIHRYLSFCFHSRFPRDSQIEIENENDIAIACGHLFVVPNNTRRHIKRLQKLPFNSNENINCATINDCIFFINKIKLIFSYSSPFWFLPLKVLSIFIIHVFAQWMN